MKSEATTRERRGMRKGTKGELAGGRGGSERAEQARKGGGLALWTGVDEVECKVGEPLVDKLHDIATPADGMLSTVYW